jgi:integrase/recombinase XerD
MRKHSPENERIKRAYFTYLKEARRLSEHSIDAAAAAISRFEDYTKYRDFKRFHTQQAVGFKRRLSGEINQRTGEALSKSTVFTALNVLRTFFQWLAGQPGYRSFLTYSDSDYFNLSEKEARVAKASPEKRTPSIEQILHVLHAMPVSSAIEKRNRAVIAFILLTGVRDGAAASLKLKHVDLGDGKVVQDAREVRTKFSKTFTTWFFPVDDGVRQIVIDWVEFLQKDMFFGPSDPLFSATRVMNGEDHQFIAVGLSRAHWSNATPIRAIFKEAFSEAGLPYFNPHSFRRTLAQLGERLCHTPEEFKAWSQNLGHETVLTTFSSYGQVSPSRQATLIRQLGDADLHASPNSAIAQAMRLLQSTYRPPRHD